MSTPLLGQHAVVIGASVAGMLTAKALTEQFAHVTVIERDVLTDSTDLRKGLPQAPHAHALLARGLQTMQRLFPDLADDLVAHGAVWADTGLEVYWHQFGATRLRTETGLKGLLFGRPLLDWRMRAHLMRDSRVTIRSGYRVKDLYLSLDQRTVTGLLIEPVGSGGLAELVTADLVVDCGGRGSHTPQWLAEQGFGAVPVSEVKAKVDYVSALYKRPANEPDWKVCMICTTPPETTLAIAMAIEDGQWILTLQSMFGEPVPSSHEEILTFLRTLPRPELYEAFRQAEPVGPLVRHSTPSNLRRHYDRLERLPEGLVVLGDASCAFNPRYGQGMSVAAMSVDLLATCLGEQPAGTVTGLARRFQRRLSPLHDQAWQVATGEDMRFPQVEGPRPLPLKLINAFLVKVFQLLSVDREALVAFLHVQHMLAPVSVLLKPGIIWRALTFRAPRSVQGEGNSIAARS
ncbi:MAG TPA: FAD-dependent monooxygenase [Symbiobacteriaceae bacterium]|nr:FAD-dependent monooxygenase [Symbiobacteriaceae bacterium]